MEEPKRTLAYLCPKCRQSVVVEQTVFRLAAAPSRLPCPCGGSALLVEMEGCAIAQVCLRNDVPFAALKSVSDHLFRESNAEEYFDFGEALEKLGGVLLPFVQALQKEDL